MHCISSTISTERIRNKNLHTKQKCSIEKGMREEKRFLFKYAEVTMNLNKKLFFVVVYSSAFKDTKVYGEHEIYNFWHGYNRGYITIYGRGDGMFISSSFQSN